MSNYKQIQIDGQIVWDTTGVNATVADVIEGKTFIDSFGQVREGLLRQDVDEGKDFKTLQSLTEEREYAAGAGKYWRKIKITPVGTEIKEVKYDVGEVTPSGGKLLSKVTIIPPKTKEIIIGASTTQMKAEPQDVDFFSKVVVNPPPTQEKEVTASTNKLEVTPDGGKLLSKVVVNPPPSEVLQIIPDGSQYSYTPSQDNKYYSKVEVLPISSAVFSTIDNLIGGGV